MRKFLAVLMLALLPAVALAQQFPLTMPFHTVYGRLGAKPGDTGPGQSIPFATLAAELGGIGGAARMYPHLGQTTSPSDCFTLIDPYGNPIACTSSTTSQGLQEFMNAAASNGWPAEVFCQGISFPAHTYVAIQASTSVTVPVAQDWSLHSNGCPLIFTVTTVPGLIIDSNGATHFDWDGIVIYDVASPNGDVTANPSCAVYINPTNNTQDGFPSLYDGYFRVKSVSVNATGGIATADVCANTNTGGVHQVLEFQELQTVATAYYSFLSFGTHGVQGSRVVIDHPHGAVNAAIKVGTTITGGNIWTVNNVAPEGSGTTAKGIWTFTSNDDWRIGTISNSDGSYGYGIYTDGSSANNTFKFATITGAGVQNWFNNSSGTNYFNGQSGLSGYQAGPQDWKSQFVGMGSGGGTTSAFIAQSAQPSYAWYTSGAAADSHLWDCLTGASNLQCRVVNDAQSAATAWLLVTRSAAAISGVAFPSGAVTLGTANTIGGSLIMEGATSGALTQTPPAVAGSAAIAWGTGSGTPAVTASSPLAINSTTGNVTCATCVTSGTLTAHGLLIGEGASTPISATAAGTAGYLAYGAGASTDPAFAQCLPNVQYLTSGSGTYTTPTCTINGQSVTAAVIDIELVGGGASGSGGGTSAGNGTAGNATCWNTTGAACTTPVYQAGGGAINAGAGGTCSGSGSFKLTLQGGNGGVYFPNGTNTVGGDAGSAPKFGVTAHGVLNGVGGPGPANSGSAGAGGGSNSSTPGGAGGSAGAYCLASITAPAATYTYAVAASTTGGTAGTSGSTGGNGGSGLIIVKAYWQ